MNFYLFRKTNLFFYFYILRCCTWRWLPKLICSKPTDVLILKFPEYKATSVVTINNKSPILLFFFTCPPPHASDILIATFICIHQGAMSAHRDTVKRKRFGKRWFLSKIMSSACFYMPVHLIFLLPFMWLNAPKSSHKQWLACVEVDEGGLDMLMHSPGCWVLGFFNERLHSLTLSSVTFPPVRHTWCLSLWLCFSPR